MMFSRLFSRGSTSEGHKGKTHRGEAAKAGEAGAIGEEDVADSRPVAQGAEAGGDREVGFAGGGFEFGVCAIVGCGELCDSSSELGFSFPALSIARILGAGRGLDLLGVFIAP